MRKRGRNKRNNRKRERLTYSYSLPKSKTVRKNSFFKEATVFPGQKNPDALKLFSCKVISFFPARSPRFPHTWRENGNGSL